MKAERQIRTENKKGLLGYRAKYKGKTVIAVMKGKECRECLGYITTEELIATINSGPYIELDKIIA